MVPPTIAIKLIAELQWERLDVEKTGEELRIAKEGRSKREWKCIVDELETELTYYAPFVTKEHMRAECQAC